MLTYIQSAILGTVQGITELFPISSLGHSVILPKLFGWQIAQDDPYFLTFLVATHTATALVLFIYFWKDWFKIARGFFRSLQQRHIAENDSDAKLAWLLLIGTIPAGLLGLLFEHLLKNLFASPRLVAGVLILNGLMLFGVTFLRPGTERVARLSWSQAFKVGLWQCLALIPGFSRTGATITGGLMAQLSQEDAARFSFLLATPIIGAAALLKLPKLLTHTSSAVVGPILFGALCAGIFAYLSIAFLTSYFETKNLKPFALYCVLAGVIASLLLIRTSSSQTSVLPASPLPSMHPLTHDWRIANHSLHHEIEGFATTTSVYPGATIQFAVSSMTPTFTADVYRLGFYGDTGAQKLTTLSGHSSLQRLPQADSMTGLIETNWPATLTMQVPAIWPSGLYLVKLTNDVGYQSYIPFVVKDTHLKPLVLVHSVLTDEAYNDWGGNSLYHGSTPALNLSRAVKVSLNRPFRNHDGAGYMLTWEYPMIKFLEEKGYQVSYLTDLDIHEHPELLTQARTIIITGHDEYWSKTMRQAYENALAAGTNLAIFAANTGYRQIRLESSPSTSILNQVIVSYGSAFARDPFFASRKSEIATEWRNSVINQPESSLLGAMYGNETKHDAPLVISQAEHWVFSGTGLKSGDKLSSVVGYEYDTYFPDLPHPPHVEVLSTSPVTTWSGVADIANTTLSTFANGSMVFNAGTVDWSAGVDSYHSKRVDPAIQKITENILNRFKLPPQPLLK